MEKQNYSPMSLLTLLPDGKVENDVRITDKIVTGVCTVYVNRTDDEKEFLLREIGVAAIDGNCNLTDAVRIAVEQAYSAAISHVAGITAEPTQVLVKQQKQPVAKPIPGLKQEPEAENPAPTPPAEKEPAPEAESLKNNMPAETTGVATDNDEKHPSVDLGTILNMPGDDEADPNEESSPLLSGDESSRQTEDGGIERLDLTGSLFPASDLLGSPDGEKPGAEDDGGDAEYQKALDTEITIFGKLHDCNNWKAGKILSERPEVVIDFCHRNSESYDGPKYTGPRTDQKEALFKLYPDAVRKAQKAA